MNALFVGRHNNDIDSMVPVAARILTEGGSVSYFIATPEISPEKDFRLRYLKSLGCGMLDIWSITPLGPFANVLRSIWNSQGQQRNLKRRAVCKISDWYFSKKTWTSSVEAMLEKIKPDLVAFDWTNPLVSGPQDKPPYCIGEIASWAATRSIPVVSMPHGLWLLNLLNFGARNYNFYDTVYVESHRRKEMMVGRGVEEARVCVSGSPRYDRSWMKQLGSILPPPPEKYLGKKFVISFFATKMVGGSEMRRLLNWLKDVASQEGVHLIVQPHPRDNKQRSFNELAGVKNIDIDVSTPASVLIRLSDAVSTLVSSVVVDAICLDKPVLYPKFLHDITTRFEEEGACMALGSSEETAGAIKRLMEGWRPAASKVGSFLEKDVYGASDDGAIDRIVKSMHELVSKKKAALPQSPS